jgi:hypothetical protein
MSYGGEASGKEIGQISRSPARYWLPSASRGERSATGSSFKPGVIEAIWVVATSEGKTQMRTTLILLACLAGTTQAIAADQYQLIPLSSAGYATKQLHKTLLVEVASGSVFGCSAHFQGLTAAEVSCSKIKVAAGSMPPGPATLSVYTTPYNAYPAIWKVNQTNGDVTFCGTTAANVPPSEWLCAEARLPQ